MDKAVICPHCGCEIKENKPTDKKFSTALLFGIISFVATCFYPISGQIAAIAGIIIGAKEREKTAEQTGLIISIIGSVFSTLVAL